MILIPSSDPSSTTSSYFPIIQQIPLEVCQSGGGATKNTFKSVLHYKAKRKYSRRIDPLGRVQRISSSSQKLPSKRKETGRKQRPQ